MISKNLRKRIFTSLILLFFIVLIFNSNFLFIYSLIIMSVYAIFEFLEMSKKIFSNNINWLIINLFFKLYIYFFCTISFFFYIHQYSKLILVLLLSCCIASDIGGFIFGKIFKGPKLTKISPNKTIAGVIGSLIFSYVILVIFSYFLNLNLDFNTLILAIITSAACQIGDLFFSYLKRKAKIKDTGNILPGHGGIIDRVDGILLGIPIGIITLIYL